MVSSFVLVVNAKVKIRVLRWRNFCAQLQVFTRCQALDVCLDTGGVLVVTNSQIGLESVFVSSNRSVNSVGSYTNKSLNERNDHHMNNGTACVLTLRMYKANSLKYISPTWTARALINGNLSFNPNITWYSTHRGVFQNWSV